jgi:two-component system, chemotaxis family, chemotaxis protein CheY
MAREARSAMAKSILIVEDDVDVATSTADLLDAEGYLTTIAANGAQALEHLERTKNLPDAILLDLAMPIMDGWEFRRQQERLPRIASIPVIVISADGNVRSKAGSLKADGCVAKPTRADALLNELERVCARSGHATGPLA